MSNRLTVAKHNTKDIDITFTDSNDNAIDISGWKIWFTVKNQSDDPDSEAVIQKSDTVSSGGSGKYTFSLSIDDTDVTPNDYIYDIQYLKTDGTLKTAVVDTFLVTNSVTEETS